MVYRYGSSTKHCTPVKQRVKVDSYCIPGEIETRGKNKNKKGEEGTCIQIKKKDKKSRYSRKEIRYYAVMF